MVIEEYPRFFDWLWPTAPTAAGMGAVIWFLLLALVSVLLGIFIGYIITAVRHGPFAGLLVTARATGQGVGELLGTSPRRVFAVMLLAIKESLRRRVLIVFVAFTLILLFAGWFLDVRNDNPGRQYLSFVIGLTNFLVLIMALLVSTLSLPREIRDRTIFTLVTKPVRYGEIVLGRILGFVAIGTFLLAVMGVFAYFFVVVGLRHSHEIDPAKVAEDKDGMLVGETSLNSRHRHKFRIHPQMGGSTESLHGHRHTIRVVGKGEERRFEVGPPQDQLLARVPVYGKLRYLDRRGQPTDEGINVGDEWTYRKYVEGGTLSAAIWTFEGVTPSNFQRPLSSEEQNALDKPESDRTALEQRLFRQAETKLGLPLELTLGVFRTNKGNIEQGITGSIVLRNPTTGWESEPRTFTSQEFTVHRLTLPRTLSAIGPDGEKRDVNLYDDLVDDRLRLEVQLQCVEGGQYLGASPYDVYLRAGNRWFIWNFFKGYMGLWMQMVIVCSFGVMFSTFLGAPVAMLTTIGTFVIGFFGHFIRSVASGEVMGGGPLESTIRIITQKNVQVDLDATMLSNVAIWGDFVLLYVMNVFAFVLPEYGKFDFGKFVAYGYDISGDLLAQQICRTFAYILTGFIVGYFCLKSREVAA